jgi:hypothetical protein
MGVVWGMSAVWMGALGRGRGGSRVVVEMQAWADRLRVSVGCWVGVIELVVLVG